MKRTVFALALLVPAFASAAVRVTMEVEHNGNSAKESFHFSENSKGKVVTPQECGATVKMKLLSEADESATFRIKVMQNEETKCNSEVVLNYGEAHTFECANAKIDASVKMTASQAADSK